MNTVLKAKERVDERRSNLRVLREEGRIPAVVYGYNTENTPISIEMLDLVKTMRAVGRNGVISLDLGGKQHNVLLHEYQEDPIRNEVIHADFLAVDLTQEVEANVRVELSEDAAGVRDGGVLQQILHELVITAKPDEIPEVIEVDVSELEIGDSIAVGEIRDNYKVTINHEDDDAIATVLAPQEEEEVVAEVETEEETEEEEE